MHQSYDSNSTLLFQEHLQNQEVGQYIQKDDILDLSISLETTETVLEFIGSLA